MKHLTPLLALSLLAPLPAAAEMVFTDDGSTSTWSIDGVIQSECRSKGSSLDGNFEIRCLDQDDLREEARQLEELEVKMAKREQCIKSINPSWSMTGEVFLRSQNNPAYKTAWFKCHRSTYPLR